MSVPLDAFRLAVLRLFSSALPAARERFHSPTGRFLEPDGGWAVTNQDVIYPLAVLYTTPHPENPHGGDPALLDLLSAGGDALRNAQDETGRMEFVKTDGSTWGWIYMPWSLFHWLQTWALMREGLDSARARRWEEGLRLAYDGVARQLAAAPRVHNIDCWHAMALVRAAALFERPDWLPPARAYIARCVAAQSPEGYWPEGGGPTTLYNRVYHHALGFYHHFTGDESVRPVLERALQFHLRFTYPDGADVETVDGRVRYHDRVCAIGWPGCLTAPEGRRYVRFLLERFRPPKPHEGLDARIAGTFSAWREAPEAPIPQQSSDFAADHFGKALVRRKGLWFAVLNGYVTPDEFLDENLRGRFRLDRQNCVSLWHERVGMLVGGGNSRFDPAFSTFSLVRGRVRCVAPDAAALRLDGHRLMAQYTCAGVGCEVVISLLDDRRAELAFRAGAGECRPVGAFTLRLRPGSELAAPDAPKPRSVHPRHSFLIAAPDADPPEGFIVAGEGWRLRLPPGGKFSWPHFPSDPYALNYGAPDGAAVASVSAALRPGGAPVRFRFEIAP